MSIQQFYTINAIIQTTNFLISYHCNNPTVFDVLDVIRLNIYHLYLLCGINLNDNSHWKAITDGQYNNNNRSNDFQFVPEKYFYYFENGRVKENNPSGENLEEMNIQEILVQLSSETFENIQSELCDLEKYIV